MSCRRVVTTPWWPAAPWWRRDTRRRRARSLPCRKVEGIRRWMSITERRTWTNRCIDLEFFVVVRCGSRCSRRCRRRRRWLYHWQAVVRLFSFCCCYYVIRRRTCFDSIDLTSFNVTVCMTITGVWKSSCNLYLPSRLCQLYRREILYDGTYRFRTQSLPFWRRYPQRAQNPKF